MIWRTRSPSVRITGFAREVAAVVDPAAPRLLAERRVGAVDEALHVDLFLQDGEAARASSFARSSTSPTSRSSRSASAAITSARRARLLVVVTRPSRSAATWPRIAVSGVRSSCETDMRKFRSSSSASASRAAISRKRSERWPISPAPAPGARRRVVPRRPRRRHAELEHLLGDAARQVRGEAPATAIRLRRRSAGARASEPTLVEHCLSVSPRRARRRPCGPTFSWTSRRQQRLAALRRAELEEDDLALTENTRVDGALRQRRDAAAPARKGIETGVEDPGRPWPARASWPRAASAPPARAYSCVSPLASRASSRTPGGGLVLARSRESRRRAITAETRPAMTAPSRKNAGSWKRRDPEHVRAR